MRHTQPGHAQNTPRSTFDFQQSKIHIDDIHNRQYLSHDLRCEIFRVMINIFEITEI